MIDILFRMQFPINVSEFECNPRPNFNVNLNKLSFKLKHEFHPIPYQGVITYS